MQNLISKISTVTSESHIIQSLYISVTGYASYAHLTQNWNRDKLTNKADLFVMFIRLKL